MLPGGFRLLPVVPVECYERAAEHIVITSIFAAVETNPTDKFSIGALGQWRPVSELLRQVISKRMYRQTTPIYLLIYNTHVHFPAPKIAPMTCV